MGAERTGLWGHLLRGHLLRGRPGSDTQPCPAGRERRRARGACRGVGASRDSRGQCCFVRAHGFPSRPRSSGPGWGQKPSVGPWPGARGRGLPAPTGASACAFPPPGVAVRHGPGETHGGGRCPRLWPCFPRARCGSEGVSPPATLDRCTSCGCGVATDTARLARATAVLTVALPCGAVFAVWVFWLEVILAVKVAWGLCDCTVPERLWDIALREGSQGAGEGQVRITVGWAPYLKAGPALRTQPGQVGSTGRRTRTWVWMKGVDLGAHRNFWKDVRALPGRSDTNLRVRVPLEPCACSRPAGCTDQSHCACPRGPRCSAKLL